MIGAFALALGACGQSETDGNDGSRAAETVLKEAFARDAGAPADSFAFDGDMRVSVEEPTGNMEIVFGLSYTPQGPDGRPQWRTRDREVQVRRAPDDEARSRLQERGLAYLQAMLAEGFEEIGGYDPALVTHVKDVARTGANAFTFRIDADELAPEGPLRDRLAATDFAATVKDGCMSGSAAVYERPEGAAETAGDDAAATPRAVLLEERRVFSYLCPADGPAYAERSELVRIIRLPDDTETRIRAVMTVESARPIGTEDAGDAAG